MSTWREYLQDFTSELDEYEDVVEDFLEAYDAWVLSTELCAGPLFDAMLAARQSLKDYFDLASDEITT